MRDSRHLPILAALGLGATAPGSPASSASATGGTDGDGCGCSSGNHAEDGNQKLLAEAMMPPAALSGGEDKLLQVGDIAKLSGKTVRAIHHYEELGLLQPH